MRTILGKMIASLGFEVITATDGKNALAVLGAGARPDLMLVDWNMPEMNGLQFVEAVRANPHWRAMRLMMVTTETEQSQMARALQAGADEYVMKPFTREVITEKLAILGLPISAP
jgi:two-component system chemotaxis response regulator CheY